MNAGAMRCYCELQAPTETRDASGGVTKTWDLAARVWAAIEGTAGREFVKGLRILPEASHIARVRYTDAATTARRLAWRGRVFNIVAVNDVDERRAELVLQVKEVTRVLPMLTDAAAQLYNDSQGIMYAQLAG